MYIYIYSYIYIFIYIYIYVYIYIYTYLHNSTLSKTPPKKQDAAHEPECIHVDHFWETKRLNSLLSLVALVTIPMMFKGRKCEVKGWIAQRGVWSVN